MQFLHSKIQSRRFNNEQLPSFRKMRKIKNKKTIYFFTGKRGGFSHFIPILRILDGENK